MREQPSTSCRELREARVVEGAGRVGEQPLGGPGDEFRGIVHGGEELEHVTRLVARAECVNGELEQRRARDAVAVGTALIDEPDCQEIVDVVGDELGEQSGELLSCAYARCPRWPCGCPLGNSTAGLGTRG